MLARNPTLPWMAGALRPFAPLSRMKPRIAPSSSLAHDEHVGDRAVGDPHLRAAQAVAAGHLPGTRDHAARIRAVVGLGQAEAADPLAAGQLRQVLLLLRFAAELIDRHHHERALHAHHRAVPRIHALDLARDQAIADVVQAGTAVLLGNRRAEQAEFAHLAEDRRIGRAFAKGRQHARGESLLAVGRSRVAHRAFVVAELLIQQQRVFPVEGGLLVIGSHWCRWSNVRCCALYERERATTTDLFAQTCA